MDELCLLARRAGALIMGHYKGAAAVETKSDGSPVTAADREANDCIAAGLARINPRLPVLSEESEIPSYETRRQWKSFWLVDPLDGTKEFISRNGEFTVNIALIEDQAPIAGVVYAPALNILYFAARGLGAFKQEDGQRARRIFSKPARPGQELVVAESRSHPSAELESFLKTVQVKDRIKVGSSLKFGLLAEGRADLYPRLGPTMEWDCAAGDCLYRYSAAEGYLDSGLRYNSPSLRFERFIAGFQEAS
jgi:3'(2'), 5'-bisphosphate nucleotidase